MLRLAVDIGGTFTDAVILDEENQRVVLSKVPSTPPDYSQGVTDSIRRLLDTMNEVESFTHGTTVGTNALIQGKVGATGLITTRGFRDILEIGRGNRVEIYDPFYRPPPPLISRDKRLEVEERIRYDGTVTTQLDLRAAREVLSRLASSGVEAIAISLINSYANSAHEEQLRDLAREVAPGKYVAVSTEISREYNEYERTSTTVVNASLLSLMDSYLSALERSAQGMGYRGRIMLMQSNGGIMTSTLARRKPVHTINSGLVGGVIAVKTLSELLGIRDIIGGDMGGTSFDVELVVGGNYETTPVMRIQTPRSGFDGYPLQIPAVDIHAIGAGGGSIAWIDDADALHVGPMSAAAYPGPACFGKGGDQPTVTDANVVLKRLNPDYFLGGEMKIQPELSLKVVKRISDHYGMDVNEAAEGILRIVVTSMAGAIRTMTVRRGIDPREFSMVSFGGAGPLHAALIARELEIPKVIISTMPGNFSAWGMLMTDLRRDYVQTKFADLGRISPPELTAAFAGLEGGAVRDLEEEGISRERSELVRGVDVRYQGQGHAITLVLPGGVLREEDVAELIARFDQEHLDRYLHNAPQESKQISAIRVTAIGRMKKVSLPKIRTGSDDPEAGALRGSRNVFLDGRSVRCAVYDRAKLLARNVVHGPAIIEERVSTTLLLESQRLTVDDYGHLVISDGAE